MIRIKRAYEMAEDDDGTRVLVDLLWPRGVNKEQLRLDGWPRDVAPSSELRKWFQHDPARWVEFKKRYFAELDGKTEAWRSLVEQSRRGNVTLIYGARDSEHNNAAALKEYLESKLGQG